LLFIISGFSLGAQSVCTTVHRQIECPAQFPGGKQALNDWVSMSRKYYPQKQKEIIGVTFCIDTAGKAVNIRLLRAAGDSGALAESEKEALRLVQNMPDWLPARSGPQCSRKVCEEITLPLVFKPGQAN
jgi:hypothetical protein